MSDVEHLEGKIIGRCELREFLYGSDLAGVYRAYDSNLWREVMIRVYSPLHIRDPHFTEFFKKDVPTLAALNHAHLVVIVDCGIDQDYPYVVTPLLQGKTLRDRLRETQLLPLENVIALLKRIASALDYLHGKASLHTDLKPDQILFDAQGNAYLFCFSMSRIFNAMPKLHGVIGNPAYLSIEQIMGKKLTPASDQYSLGVIAYELIAGHRPFESDTVTATIMKQINEPAPSAQTFRPDLPAELDPVFARVLAKQPGDRFGNVSDFAQAFETAIKAFNKDGER